MDEVGTMKVSCSFQTEVEGPQERLEFCSVTNRIQWTRLEKYLETYTGPKAGHRMKGRKASLKW